jgi:septal ring-binding cell division protein DamX
MGRGRKSDSRDAARGVLDERRRLIAAGSLFGAVVVVLLLGFVLRTPEPTGASTLAPLPARTVPAEDETRPALAVPAPVPAPSSRPPQQVTGGPSLAARAEADRDRLVNGGGSFTIQLMVACDADNAARHVGAAGGAPELYVLPFTLDGNACFRLCWGSYATRTAAESAGNLPARYESEFPKRQIRAVGDLAR